MARTKDYTAQNAKLFEAGLKKYAEKTIKPMLEAMLRRIATIVVSDIQKSFNPVEYFGGGTETFPIWTGNLRDATGVGIYIDGALAVYHPTEISVESQFTESEENIIGSQKLDEAFEFASTQFSTGIWIVLFSSVPYAFDVNEYGSPLGRGVGFFNELENNMESCVRNVLLNLKPVA